MNFMNEMNKTKDLNTRVLTENGAVGHKTTGTENELGVALVSGFSPAVCNIVLSGELDPYEALVEALMVKRYDPIEYAIEDFC